MPAPTGWMPLSFTEALKCESYNMFGILDVVVQVDTVIVFRPHRLGVEYLPYYGRVHKIDLTSEYPLTIEWYDGVNPKRLSRFHPDDFASVMIKESLDAAKASVWN